jgi:hypothetical protein
MLDTGSPASDRMDGMTEPDVTPHVSAFDAVDYLARVIQNVPDIQPVGTAPSGDVECVRGLPRKKRPGAVRKAVVRAEAPVRRLGLLLVYRGAATSMIGPRTIKFCSHELIGSKRAIIRASLMSSKCAED